MNEPDASDLFEAHQLEQDKREEEACVGACAVCDDPAYVWQGAFKMANGDIVHEDHFLKYAMNELGAELIRGGE